MFVVALIFVYFDPECYMWIETDITNYIISGILSQLTFSNLDQ